MKKMSKILTVLVCLMMILSACGSKATEPTAAITTSSTTSAAVTTSADTQLAPVELNYYVPEYNTQPGLQAVNDEVNKVLTQKINATIKMNILDFGSYGQKMNVLVASATPIDIMWTASWSDFGYGTNVNKGTFLEAGELFQRYAPKTYESLGKYWDTAKIGGKIYGMPNELMWATENGYTIKEDLATKYGFDGKDKTIKIEELEPYLEKVKAGEPGIIPLLLASGGLGSWPEASMNLFDINQWGCTQIGDKSLKVLSFFETPEFKQRVELARKWYTKGYINKDAATNKNITPLEPKAFATYNATHINTGMEAMPEIYQPYGGPVFYTAVSPTTISSNAGMISMQCIGKNSKNPERAAMFLELTHSDADFIHLFIYGIKDVHYTSTDGIHEKPIDGAGYGISGWLNVNCHLKLLAEGQANDSIQREIDANNAAMAPEFSGFVYDPTNNKTEIANCTAVCTEYLPGLATGTLDPATILPTFISKLKLAGIDNIIAETQKQMDAWKVAAGK